jgi:hypothetical protein
VEGDTPPELPELPGRSVRLKSAERFEAATWAVVVQGGNRAYDQSLASTSASASFRTMVFPSKVAWYGPATCHFLFYKRLFLK